MVPIVIKMLRNSPSVYNALTPRKVCVSIVLLFPSPIPLHITFVPTRNMTTSIDGTVFDIPSIMADKTCQTCRHATLETPTIVCSRPQDYPYHPCECRDLKAEWALNAHSYAVISYAGQRKTQLSHQDQSNAATVEDLQSLLARFSLAQTGFCYAPTAIKEVASVLPHDPNAPFSDACLSVVSQIYDHAMIIPPGFEQTGNRFSQFTPDEVDRVASVIENRHWTASCQSYRSRLMQELAKTAVTNPAESSVARGQAISTADLDPADFAPWLLLQRPEMSRWLVPIDAKFWSEERKNYANNNRASVQYSLQ